MLPLTLTHVMQKMMAVAESEYARLFAHVMKCTSHQSAGDMNNIVINGMQQQQPQQQQEVISNSNTLAAAAAAAVRVLVCAQLLY